MSILSTSFSDVGDPRVDAAGNVHCIETAIRCLGILGTHAQVGVVRAGSFPQFDVSTLLP